jgi:hypothetical protein
MKEGLAMRRFWLSAVSLALLAAAAPQEASAQIFIQPPRVHVRPVRPWWVRPRVVIVPPAPPMVAPVPQVCCAQPLPPPPPVYVQPYPQQPCCAQPLPPPVYVQPAPPPPPPVYVQPAPPPPVYVQPAPQAAPLPLPPPVVLQRPRLVEKPQWRSRFGLGARFAGVLNTDQLSRSSHLGFGGELLFRVARHLSLEVAGEYQRTVDEGFARMDVPVTFGMRVHIGPPEWVVSPYFVVASGVTYANLDFLHAHDVAWFLEGQAGGGLEIRLGQRFALTGDVRGVGRVRMTPPSEAAANTIAVNGKPFQPMGNQGGVQFRLGAALYF